MGFLWAENEKPAITKTKGKKKEEVVLTVGCDGCALRKTWGTITSPRMPMTLEGDEVEILIIGEAPGEEEDAQGRQFVGKAGAIIRKQISRRDLNVIAWQNTVRCRPPDNRMPTPAESHSCRDYLDQDITTSKPKVILGLGGVPLKRFFGPRKEAPSITEAYALKFPVQVGEHLCWYYPCFHPMFSEYARASEPVFRADLREMFRTYKTWGKPVITKFDPSNVICPKDELDARLLLEKMQVPLAVDLETTQLRPYQENARLLTAAISDGITTIAFPLRWPGTTVEWGMSLLLEVVQTKKWIAHSAAMELGWLWNELGWGWFPNNFEDTMAVGRILHQRKDMLSLEDMTRVHLGTNVKVLSDIDTKQVVNHKLEDVLIYNGLDAQATALLYRKLEPKLTRNNRDNVDRILASTRSTVAMELKGLPFDISVTNKLHKEFSENLVKTQERILGLPEVRAYTALTQMPFKIGSNKQLLEVVKMIPGSFEFFKQTKKGNISVDEEFLTRIEHLSELPKAMLEEREYAKQLSTYLEPIRSGMAVHPDGLLHPGYTVVFTHTGRLSSENPNIQNWSKHVHKEIRSQIVAPKGYLIFPIDYGQLEARTYAMATRDPNFVADVIKKVDIHARNLERALELHPAYIDEIAVRIKSDDKKKCWKAGRQFVKNGFVFATLYGARAETCVKYSYLPVWVIEKLADRLWEDYPIAKDWMEKQRSEYNETGSVSTLTGMIRHGIMIGNEPLNTPIQGTSTGHLVLDCQNELSTISLKEKDWCFHPRINLHDDLTFFLPDHLPTATEYLNRITEVMVKVRYNWQIVPLTVEMSVGENWADVEEFGVVTGDYVK